MFDKITFHSSLGTLINCPDADIHHLSRELIAEDAVWYISHPVNTLHGRSEVLDKLILPLRTSLKGIHRRDEVFISGLNRRDDGGEWSSAICHYVANFKEDLFGIKPSNRLVFLRSGEFYRIDNNKITQAYLNIDFIDLMRQAGTMPLPQMLGTEMLFPSPATHDGVHPPHPEHTKASLDLVEQMLGDLKEYNPEDFTSKGQTGVDGAWHDNMLWYGPGGIGANFQWSGFEKDHRAPFLIAFPDRVGGNHVCRIADGNYAAVCGWPSMKMTHKGDYLGVKATNKALTLRVMDFYRCANGKIMENWVLLDYLDLFKQMGVDLIPPSP